ncbi:MAG: hypothetical protein K9N35_07680 [Candidatus Marinimicrobia bacterium]|nr:hypothetical protein [Candidatus Neomarinimicrobiota bacterium]
MRSIPSRLIFHYVLMTLFILGYSSCSLPNLGVREYLRPVRKYLNKERNYWTDRIEFKGESGTEIIYYKNGRPALERYFNEDGLLKTVSYMGRDGAVVRFDSLVYSGDQLVSGYYFSEPEHRQILKFLSYKKQGQLSQRSWFDSDGSLLSREFFLFDRNGDRRMRMIFSGEDSLLFSETFKPGSDELEIQSIYSVRGNLARQIQHARQQPTYQYDFDEDGTLIRLSQINDDGSTSWSSDMYYDSKGGLEQCAFSTNGHYLFSYTGDLEVSRKSLRSWQNPYQPNISTQSIRIDHKNLFIVETINRDGLNIKEFRLPESKALFKRSTYNEAGQHLTDTLFTNNAGPQPISVILYDTLGLVKREYNYNLAGIPEWRHTWYRDDRQRVIREELTELPNTFSQAVTRFYDCFGQPALSERFSSPDSFDGSWVFYHGGGINKTLFYDNESVLRESWLIRPAGDTVRHSMFTTVDYIKIESKLGPKDSLRSYRRYTDDGLLNWELLFDREGRLIQETHRKKDGSIYREVVYEPASRIFTSSTYAPINSGEVVAGSVIRGELASQIVNRLNPRGEVVQIVSKNSSGQTEWEKRYAYRAGLLVKSAQLGADGKPIFISTYTHNDLGQLLTERAVDKYDSLVHTVDYRYEGNQLILKTFSSKFTGITSSNRFYYDESGRLQRNEIIEAQRFIEAVEYSYYPEFYLRIAIHYDPSGAILRKEIENYFNGSVFDLGKSDPERSDPPQP